MLCLRILLQSDYLQALPSQCVGCDVRSVQTVNGMHLFTTTGYKYFRSFQISLCAGSGDSGEFPLAVCVNNASLDMQVCHNNYILQCMALTRN